MAKCSLLTGFNGRHAGEMAEVSVLGGTLRFVHAAWNERVPVAAVAHVSLEHTRVPGQLEAGVLTLDVEPRTTIALEGSIGALELLKAHLDVSHGRTPVFTPSVRETDNVWLD